MLVWRRLITLAAVGVFSLTIVSHTWAQQAPSSGLRISPTRTELSLEKGKSSVIKVTLKNVSGGDITAKGVVNDFESDNENGEPKVLVDNSSQTATSVKPFLSGVGDVPLKKEETRNIDITVKIPDSASPGAYYGALRYSAVPAGVNQEEKGKVALTASVASLVLIEVPGNISEQIQLKNILVYNNDSPGKVFFKPPNRVGIRIKNTGNSFSRPFGRITITKTFGGKEVYSYELNNTTPRNNVLPGTIRIFKDDIKNINQPGRYTVTAGVSHGSNGDVLTERVSFWYIPVWLAATLAFLVVLALLGLFLLYRKLRKAHKARRRY